MQKKLMFSLLFLVTCMVSCQSSVLTRYNKVSMGMEKDQVLELMGSPKDVVRLHGKDRWKYVFYEDAIRFVKEVHFLEGSVIYVGDMYEPPYELSAVAADKRNAESEIELQRKEQARAEDAARNGTTLDNYTSEVKGDSKVRYVKEFEEIR